MKSKRSEEKAPHVTKGSVFDDLGFTPAEALELKVKAEIYGELLNYIEERGYSQKELGKLLGILQPEVSNLLTGKVSRFSVGKLIKLAGKLNLGAKISLTRPTSQPPARIVDKSAKTRRRAAAA
jgi:predicted XRE-type DNA-binding protein